MANLFRPVLFSSALALLAIACETPESATSLNFEGPPMIRQVFVYENVMDSTGRATDERILGFGSHVDYPMEKTRAVTKGTVVGNALRVVVDELLVGNYLEEIACRTRTIPGGGSCTVPGGYSRVPEGATPDDIADCSVADDILTTTCKGSKAVCLNEAGVPCGVLDEDENGSADALRFIAGQVKLVCENTTLGTRFEIDMDPGKSYWQPSGNQLVPPGTDASTLLGPALVLTPIKPVAGAMGAMENKPLLPTSQTCRLTFADDIVDKDGIRVCTPPGGDVGQACATDGDVSGFSFTTLGLGTRFIQPTPGATNVPRNTRLFLFLWNATLDPTSAASGSITVTAGANPVTNFTAAVNTDATNLSSLSISLPADLEASTTYTITLNGAKDIYGVPPPTPVTLSFTTAP